ncbi:hypothetical protein [Asanoa hainanensis]|uniref:hypothetical protein n=1 Tax=Asanoa hainanensis TaxID=560556 RepID=UPI00117D0876|nr:hypothetical protein [Asanoa hainanensis]
MRGRGVPGSLVALGQPDPVSEAILAGVGESQLGPAREALRAWGTVAFGPLSVCDYGLVTPGGRVAWSELVRVRLDAWPTGRFYAPHTERETRVVRIVFEVCTVADFDGRPPTPNSFDLPHLTDIDVVRRVAVLADGRLENAEIVSADWQLPNLPTLLRLLRERHKLA